MARFLLRRSTNMDGSLCHAINFLIAYEVLSLESSLPMFKAFHSRGEDVLIDLPDGLDFRFKEALDAVGFRYEEI